MFFFINDSLLISNKTEIDGKMSYFTFIFL